MKQLQIQWWPIHLMAQIVLALLLLLTVLLSQIEAAESTPYLIRIGYSLSLFNDVNKNDALASMKVLGDTFARNKNLPAQGEAFIFSNPDDLRQALLNKEIDIVAISTLDYEIVQHEVDFDEIFLSVKGEEAGEEYLLVAHRNGPVQNLEDLAERRILLQQNVQLCLAPLWLDTLLAKKGLKPIATLAGEVIQKNTLTDVLLPVFFKQADACVVNRRGLETMVELNPQLGKQLVVVESSSKLVPTVFAFHRGYTPPFKEALLESFRTLHESANGRQVLLIFKESKIVEVSKASLDPTLKLISAFRQTEKH